MSQNSLPKITLSPALPAELAMDLADPDSEMSQFVRAFFLDYMSRQVADDQREATLANWQELESDEEVEKFLQEIDPDFENKFQAELTKELMQMFKETNEEWNQNE